MPRKLRRRKGFQAGDGRRRQVAENLQPFVVPRFGRNCRGNCVRHAGRHRIGAESLPAAELLHCGAGSPVRRFAAPARADEAEGASFFDDFDGFNPRLWGVSHGWSNGDWQNCTWDRSAVRVEGGILSLLFAPGAAGTRAFTCGEIQSRARYGHGTYEARLRTPAGSGLNAAFFTYIGPSHDSPHDEIDVEILTRDTGAVSFNTYVDAVPANGATVALDPPSDSRFVHYAFAWTETGAALVRRRGRGAPDRRRHAPAGSGRRRSSPVSGAATR